jgi:hypothetical protein
MIGSSLLAEGFIQIALHSSNFTRKLVGLSAEILVFSPLSKVGND